VVVGFFNNFLHLLQRKIPVNSLIKHKSSNLDPESCLFYGITAQQRKALRTLPARLGLKAYENVIVIHRTWWNNTTQLKSTLGYR